MKQIDTIEKVLSVVHKEWDMGGIYDLCEESQIPMKEYIVNLLMYKYENNGLTIFVAEQAAEKIMLEYFKEFYQIARFTPYDFEVKKDTDEIRLEPVVDFFEEVERNRKKINKDKDLQ